MHVYGEVHSNVLVLLLLAVQAGVCKCLLAYLLCVECYIEEVISLLCIMLCSEISVYNLMNFIH